LEEDLKPADNFIVPVWIVVYDDKKWESLVIYKYAKGGIFQKKDTHQML